MDFTEANVVRSFGNSAISPNRISTMVKINRVTFDPKKKEHLESVKTFIETGNWGAVQFYCEFPFTDVPMTVLMKYTAHKLKADLTLRHKQLAVTTEKDKDESS